MLLAYEFTKGLGAPAAREDLVLHK
jgi:hypothetical protein